MLTTKDLSRPKQPITRTDLALQTGDYDHASLRRWNGKDADLVRISMKSSTLFDGEAANNEGDPSPV